MAHTPAPWIAGSQGKARVVYVGPDMMFVPGPFDDRHVEGNARLIAAAPETLKALQELLDELDRIGILGIMGANEVLDQAEAAIAKATTEEGN
jgi:hypothetical protein